MPRKIPTDHRHEPPGELVASGGGEQNLPMVQYVSEICPNDERIAALERQLALRKDHLPVVSDEHTEQRFAAMAQQISNLRSQVETIKGLPRLSPDDVNNLSTALNTRVKSMIDEAITQEVSKLKIRISSMERASAPSLAKEVEQLGNIVIETGKLVASLDERGLNLEQDLRDARATMQTMHREFNQDLSKSLRAVVETLQAEPA